MSTRGPVEKAIEGLARLGGHLEAVRSGTSVTSDDIASVLHLFVGHGRGYDLLQKATDELGIDEPRMPSWGHDIPEEAEGLPVQFGFNGIPHEPGAQLIPISQALDQQAVRLALPNIEPQANWPWGTLIKKSRNAYGSHADDKPPQWLERLRYYPIAGTSALSFLMWHFGEAFLQAVTELFAQAGLPVDPYSPAHHYLGGIDMDQGYVAAKLRTDGKVEAWTMANLKLEAQGVPQAIPVLGGHLHDRPFVLGVEKNKKVGVVVGAEQLGLDEVVTEFRKPGSTNQLELYRPPRPNRQARRNAARKARRNRPQR